MMKPTNRTVINTLVVAYAVCRPVIHAWNSPGAAHIHTAIPAMPATTQAKTGIETSPVTRYAIPPATSATAPATPAQWMSVERAETAWRSISATSATRSGAW